MARQAREALDEIGVGHLDVDARLRDLGIASKHLVAVARALSIDARVVIMDEPTAALSYKEVEELFRYRRTAEERRQGHPLHQPQVRGDRAHRRPLRGVSRRRDGGRGLDSRTRAATRSSADGRPLHRPDFPRPASADRRAGAGGAPGCRIRPNSTTSASNCARAKFWASTALSARAAARSCRRWSASPGQAAASVTLKGAVDRAEIERRRDRGRNRLCARRPRRAGRRHQPADLPEHLAAVARPDLAGSAFFALPRSSPLRAPTRSVSSCAPARSTRKCERCRAAISKRSSSPNGWRRGPR